MINSNEPQYKTLRLIYEFQKSEINNKEILDNIFTHVELINIYSKKVNSQSFEERAIRTMAEVYYWGDMTVKEIVFPWIVVRVPTVASYTSYPQLGKGTIILPSGWTPLPPD